MNGIQYCMKFKIWFMKRNIIYNHGPTKDYSDCSCLHNIIQAKDVCHGFRTTLTYSCFQPFITMHYAEKYMGVGHGSFWFCMSAPIKMYTSHIFMQRGRETCRLMAKLDAPNVHSSLQLQFIFKESKFKIKYYLASTRSPHSV